MPADIRIIRCGPGDIDDWVALRAALWPEADAEIHRAEVEFALGAPQRWRAAIARDGGGEALGLAEASIRTDHVNGCETTPVLFLEGLYVLPPHRRRGIATALVGEIEGWGRARSCREFASDALVANTASHLLHGALGFVETERVVYFRKPIGGWD